MTRSDMDLPPSAAPESRWSSISNWRNWRLPVKLGAVVLVPVIFAVVLGVAQINRLVEEADLYRGTSEQVEIRNKVQPLLIGLQEERTLAAEFLADPSRGPEPLTKRAAAVTAIVGQAKPVLEKSATAGPRAEAQAQQVTGQLAQLPLLRKQIMSGSIDPVTATQTYNGILTALLGQERAVISSIADREVIGTANALQEMSSVENEARIQHALVGAGLAKGEFSKPLLDSLSNSRARMENRLNEFRASATAEQQAAYDQAASSPAQAERNRILDVLATLQPGDSASALSQQQWDQNSATVNALTGDVRSQLSEELANQAKTLEQDASNAAGLDTVVLVSALLVAAGISIVITRQMLRSLETLRTGALNTAQHHLPEAVESIRDGGQPDASAHPVEVDTTDEIGQVAGAFDQVHEQALRLASEQATLRRNYSDSFINVSRRSQSLLERQLRLFEQLEQDEEDPDQLATLFQLDHLATRMRRNNENQMVLSGSDLARRFSQPAALADVLRAGVSEIEQYPRVTVQPAPDVRLVGYAASDLVRLTAELLDNAANFSSPESTVTVSSHQAPDGSLSVDILDRGIGMGSAELARANERLTGVQEMDPATSRRMGLFVAGRLAARHGITARLHGGPEVEGVRAMLWLPAELVLADDRPVQQQPTPAHGGGRNGVAHKDVGHNKDIADPAAGTKRHVLEGEVRPGEIPQQSAPPRHGSSEPPTSSLPWDAPTTQPPASAAPPAVAPQDPPTSPGLTPVDPRQSPGEAVAPESFAAPDSPRGLFEPASDQGAENGAANSVGGLFTPNAGAQSPEERPPEPGRDAEWSWPDADGQGQHGQDPEDPEDEFSGAEGGTPIFDQMAPQWFRPAAEDARHQARAQRSMAQDSGPPEGSSDAVRADQPAASPGSHASAAERGTGAWNLGTDDAQRRADAAASAEPGAYTSAGLPRRTPRAQLAPGSAPAQERDSGAETAAPRSPHEVSERLSSFKQGARRGHSTAPAEDTSADDGTRSAAHEDALPGRFGGPGVAESGQPEQPPYPPQPTPRRHAQAGQHAQPGQPAHQDQQDQPGQRYQSMQQPQPARYAESGQHAQPAHPPQPAQPPISDDAVTAWNLGTDEVQRRVDAAASAEAGTYTSAGLPRRTPRARLAPGSAAGQDGESPNGDAAAQRSPQEVSERLSSFKQGARRRHRDAPGDD